MTTHEPSVQSRPFKDSSPLLGDAASLSRRLSSDGYLLLKQLLPPEDVMQVRRDVLGVLADRGWLVSSPDGRTAVVDADAFGQLSDEEAEFGGVVVGAAAYRSIYQQETFHRLAHHPRLLWLYEMLFNGPVFVHPRTIARIMVPSERSSTTPVHQDFIHVQGSNQTMTAWVPLGDCPMSLGGLSVLQGSHREGILSYRPAPGAGDLEAYLCDMDYPWVSGDFAAGDVLTFTSQTVHKSLPNQLGDVIRLSVDYRYQPVSQPVDQASLEPHLGIASWEEIYDGWQSEELQYFWRGGDSPEISEWDEDIRWQQDRIC